MSLSAKNKENMPVERKKLSKDTKPLKSKLLLRECCPLKNEGLHMINRSLDMSQLTIKSSRKRNQTKSTSKRIRSKNTSECSLKDQQKTRKVIPIPLDDSLFKKPLSEKTLKSKNSRKQSEYVSYLIQAQRKAMNSLASIDNSQLSNCHQIQKLESLNNNEIHQLREQMQGLKYRFERLESEHNINEKESNITLQDVGEKDHATIDMGVLGHHRKQNLTTNENQLQDQMNFKTIEVQKKVEKDVAEKYGSIIAQYQKMFAFYKERLDVCERDFETEKQREKVAQQENQKLKMQIHSKENQLKRRQKAFEVEKNQLKQEISILEKSLNKKNKELLSRNEELTVKENQLKQKELEISELKNQERNEICKIQNQKSALIENHLKQRKELEETYKLKIAALTSENQETETKYNEALANLTNELSFNESKIKQKNQQMKILIEQNNLKNQEISSLNLQLTEDSKIKEQDLTKLKEQLILAQNTIIEKQIQWKAKQTEYLELMEKNKQTSNVIIKQQSQRILALKNQLNSQQISYKTQVSILTTKILSFEVQISQKSKELSKMMQKDREIQKLKGILNQFTQEVKEIKNDLTQNQKYIQELEKSKDQFINELKRQKQSFSKQREELIRKQCKIQEQLKQKESIILQKQTEIINFSTISSQKQQQAQILVTSINDQKSSLTQQVQSLSLQVQSLLQTKQSILSEKEQLLTKVWKLNQIITANYDLALEIKDRHNAEILNKDNAVISAIREVEKIRAEKDILEKTLKEKQGEITILREQLISLTEEGEKKLQSIKEKHDSKLLNWTAEIDSFKNQLHQKEKEITQLTKIIQTKYSQLAEKDQCNTKLSQRIEDQQQKIRRLQNTISQNNQTISSIKAQNKELSVQLQTITEELFSLTSRYEEAQSTQRQITQRKAEEINQIYEICEENKRQIIESMRAKIDQLAVEIQQWENKIKEKDQHIAHLQKQIETIQILKNQVQELKKKLLQSALASKGRIVEMQKLQEKQQKTFIDLQNSQQHVKQLEQKNSALENKIKDLNQKMTQKETSTEKLLCQLSQSREKQNTLLQKISILKQENRSIISTYNHQLQQRKQIIEDLMKEKRLLYQKLNGEGI